MVYIKSHFLGTHKVSPQVNTMNACILQWGDLYPWEIDRAMKALNTVSETLKDISETVLSYAQKSHVFLKKHFEKVFWLCDHPGKSPSCWGLTWWSLQVPVWLRGAIHVSVGVPPPSLTWGRAGSMPSQQPAPPPPAIRLPEPAAASGWEQHRQRVSGCVSCPPKLCSQALRHRLHVILMSHEILVFWFSLIICKCQQHSYLMDHGRTGGGLDGPWPRTGWVSILQNSHWIPTSRTLGCGPIWRGGLHGGSQVAMRSLGWAAIHKIMCLASEPPCWLTAPPRAPSSAVPTPCGPSQWSRCSW